jgi:hypothetical protein
MVGDWGLDLCVSGQLTCGIVTTVMNIRVQCNMADQLSNYES